MTNNTSTCTSSASTSAPFGFARQLDFRAMTREDIIEASYRANMMLELCELAADRLIDQHSANLAAALTDCIRSVRVLLGPVHDAFEMGVNGGEQ